MFTRTAFCEDCYKKGRPHKDNLFGVYGQSNEKIWVYKLDHNVHTKDLGFTPHFFTVEGAENGIVYLDACCGFHNCGICFIKNNAGILEINFVKSKKLKIPEEDFKVLYAYKDLGYKLI